MGVVKLSEYRPGTNRVVCPNPVSESEVCGFAWELAVPTTGKVNYQLACLRCGHAYEVIVKAPTKPAPVCYHDRGWGYVDPHGRHRCSACGEILGDARAPHGTA